MICGGTCTYNICEVVVGGGGGDGGGGGVSVCVCMCACACVYACVSACACSPVCVHGTREQQRKMEKMKEKLNCKKVPTMDSKL